MNKKLNIAAVIALCGVCISFYIGAGFATMQEVVQYEASYGSRFPVVILVAAAIYVYTNISFATNGNRLQLARGGDIYAVYCGVFGEKTGKLASVFFDYFSALFCYMSFIVMCGGASSTATQQWGTPQGVGAVMLTALAVVTVVFGLKGILKSLSALGLVIIAMILMVSIITAVSGAPNLSGNMAAVDSGAYADAMKQVGAGNPFSSGASYGGFVILWFAAFCCIALIGHIGNTAAADIPALVLAGKIIRFWRRYLPLSFAWESIPRQSLCSGPACESSVRKAPSSTGS